jgi:antitoxin (DNA-binding transcriptional repressor) of toxin-antitoxin stability system
MPSDLGDLQFPARLEGEGKHPSSSRTPTAAKRKSCCCDSTKPGANAGLLFSVAKTPSPVYDVLMTIKVQLKRLQADLPNLLKKVEAGDTLVVCKNKKAIAKISPVKKKRPVGLGRGEIIIQPNCFDPLPEDILKGFEGNMG